MHLIQSFLERPLDPMISAQRHPLQQTSGEAKGALLRLGSYRLSLTVHLLGVYSGVRALVNRLNCLLLPRPCLSVALNRCTLESPSGIKWDLRVHARRNGPQGLTGIISARLRNATIHPLLYRYLCLCSHFGCGHVEVAFLEREGEISIYAVRNTALSNVERFGFKRLAQALGPRREKQLFDLAQAMVSLLREHGLKVRALAPAECVRLSVNPFLLHPGREHQNRRILLQRARRLGMRIAAGSEAHEPLPLA